ncbi:MAG: MBL fold metallo-hydrolase [Desulfobacula sp.]|nr:MBL fold metallo-hydrolase [Desulfobacula sp.]MCK5348409.1 MBL fold metallo-hydrolase [Desulfobacula sp.]
MTVRLTTLCDNLAGSVGYVAEWGLSILVQYKDEAVLLDTGGTDSVIRNAIQNGINLNQITRIVLSHGHKDHTGGLRHLLQILDAKRQVILHPEAWASKYASRAEPVGSEMHYIGIPYSKEELEHLGAKFTLSREPVWISDEIVVTGEVPLQTSFESIDKNLFVKIEGEYQMDTVPDDQALVVKTSKGLVVILGCAHHGMINTLQHAQKITGEERVHAVVGGTHLFRAGPDQLEQTIAALEEFNVAHIGVSHCTGMPASMALMQHFKDRFFFNHVGKVMEF